MKAKKAKLSKNIDSTLTAKIYGTVLANPGITTRGIRAQLGLDGTSNVARIVYALCQRRAITPVPGDTPRAMKYYKGPAPVILRQAAGVHQKNIEARRAPSAVEQDMDMLRNAIKDLAKAV